jgi:hypothetical protein
MNGELKVAEKELEKDFKRGFGVLEKITFVSDLLSKQNEIRNMLDMRANIIIGFNSALIVFFVTRFQDTVGNSIVFLIPVLAFGVSLALAIVALKPPRFMAKKGQKESLFYHHYIDSMALDEYQKNVYEAMGDENKIYNAYITETYNLTKYSNIPRKVYLYLAIRALIYGIILSVFAYGMTYLLAYIYRP